jgi:hypothetical protein
MMNDWTETLLLDDSFIILKYNVFIDRGPCTKLHKRKQKDRTKTSVEFPNHVFKDYALIHNYVGPAQETILKLCPISQSNKPTFPRK